MDHATWSGLFTSNIANRDRLRPTSTLTASQNTKATLGFKSTFSYAMQKTSLLNLWECHALDSGLSLPSKKFYNKT